MTLRHKFGVAVFATILAWLIMFSSITLDPVAIGFLVLGSAFIFWYDFFALWLEMRRDRIEERAYLEREEARYAKVMNDAEWHLNNTNFDPVTKNYVDTAINPVQTEGEWDGK